MTEKNIRSFNLVDAPWIPVVDVGRVSLLELFSNHELKALGGNPVQKIAVLKLLLAIAQAANHLPDTKAWEEKGPVGIARSCISYLERWKHRFDLYDPEYPFLQLPSASKVALQSYGAVIPYVATGNTTVLTESQMERQLDDAEKALVLVTLMGFALGGKKTDNSIVFSKGYSNKSRTAKPGPAVSFRGLLHSFTAGEILIETLWLNLVTEDALHEYRMFNGGIGKPPWERMPAGEACPVAEELKTTLMGRLVPVCRFCLLTEKGLHYTEGIQHMNYQDGIFDPTVAADTTRKKVKVLWADPGKRPWRQLPALLSFIKHTGSSFDCFQLRTALPRASRQVRNFAVWSGGLKVSRNAGEQFFKGTDDFVESEVWLSGSLINETWFSQLQHEMKLLEKMAKQLYGSIRAYYTFLNAEGDGMAARGTSVFWQLCENDFQDLVDACDVCGDDDDNELAGIRKRFIHHALRVYDRTCPSDTARQLEAWAMARPVLGKFLSMEV